MENNKSELERKKDLLNLIESHKYILVSFAKTICDISKANIDQERITKILDSLIEKHKKEISVSENNLDIGDTYYIPSLCYEDKKYNQYRFGESPRFDLGEISLGVVRKTKEEAILLSEKFILLAKMDQWVKQNNPKDWVPDFSNLGQTKHGILQYQNEIRLDQCHFGNPFIHPPLATKELAEKFLSVFKDDYRKTFYLLCPAK